MADRLLALTPDALVMMDTIARTGSFAAAARELGKVPSALTYSVRQLEEALDVLLFDRSSRQAQLTAAGSELLHEGRRLLSEMDAVANRVRRVASGWETQLAISVEDILSMPTIFELVQAFCEIPPDKTVAAQAHNAARDDQGGPATRLRLRTDVLSGTWESLISGQVDLAIGVSARPGEHAGIEVRPLGKIPFVFCVSPNHPLARAEEPLTDSQLVTHRAVAVADTAQRLAPMTVNLLPGQDVLTVPTMLAKLDAQLHGLGGGFVPEPMARVYLDAGRLVCQSTQRVPRIGRLYYAWRNTAPAPIGRALQWWLEQLGSATTRTALLTRHAHA